MPAKVKVRILAGRNLPVMDKSSDASDAFVEVKLANTTYKTEVYRRSLNPFWNSEWFRFEVSDQELQDEPLQVRIMDYDTYSANDAIGKVYINLNPLLVTPSKSMSGWLPIYDTLHGIRGEINVMVKLNIFADNNRFRQSSCGVRFFFSDIPNGYRCDAILGFVDELLVNDDPEYQWIDKIRTPRASNEARQTLFTKLSGEVQRKLGLKAEILGGNAVIGYQQSFDLEGGSGIVGRGIGTAVVLSRINCCITNPVDEPNDLFSKNNNNNRNPNANASSNGKNKNNTNATLDNNNGHQSQQNNYAQRSGKLSQQSHLIMTNNQVNNRHTKLSLHKGPSNLVHSISAE